MLKNARTDAALTEESLAVLRSVSQAPSLNPLLNGEIDVNRRTIRQVLQRLDWLERLHNQSILRASK